MKDFGQYLKEEIELSGNRGLPDDFMGDTDRKASREVGFQRKDTPPNPPIPGFPRNETNLAIERLMELGGQSDQVIYAGRDEEIEDRLSSLEQLAEDTVLELYGDILDGVILDIKLVRRGNVAMEIPEMQQVPQQPPTQQRDQWLDDIELAKKIDKQKLINNVIQGEGLNTKNVLHNDIIKYGLQDIFGPQSTRIFNIWDEISKIAAKMDWLIPIPDKAGAMTQRPEGMAGAVHVTWEEQVEEEESQDEDETQEEREKREQEESENIAKQAGKAPDMSSNDDEEESEFSKFTPKIKVRAVDFPMLLHEAIKGIYELVGAISLPGEESSEEEKKDAETVLQNVTSMSDEAEDFRYGPFIAGYLRDAVNECRGIDNYDAMRAHVFGRLCEMDATQFLSIMKKILDPNQSAKSELEIIVNEINGIIESEERDFQISQIDNADDDDFDSDPNFYGENEPDDDDDDEYAGEHGEESELDKLIARTARGEETSSTDDVSEEDPYAKMSQPDLMRAMDAALDSDDMDLVKKIGKYIKNESLFFDKVKNYLRS